MEISPQTVIWDILEAMPESKELFLQHGCDMDAECNTTAMTNTLDEAVEVCHLSDLDGLILELQALAELLLNQEQARPQG